MPEVTVTHDSLSDQSAATEPPKRPPVKPGDYLAIIMAAPLGTTQGPPVLHKVAVEFQLLHEDKTNDTSEAGRRVFQDYILEKDASKPDLSAQRRYELRMLLDACQVPFSDKGFNTDHLISKTVKITVRHRSGTKKNEKGEVPVFTNVVKVDSSEEISDADIAV